MSRLLRVFALVCCTVIGVVTSASAVDNVVMPEPPGDPQRADTEHAARLRAELGLDASASTIERAVNDVAAFPDTTWGIPLTAAEAVEIERRIDVWNSVLPAVAIAEQDPTWAGWWLDHEDGGTPVLMFAADPATKREQVETLIPAAARVRIEKAARPFAALQDERTKVLEAEADLAKKGVILTSVGIDVRGNQLTVGVEAQSAAADSAVASIIGSAVDLHAEPTAEADSCPATSCTPFKGGIGITDQNGNWPCTVGYPARRTDTSPDKLVFVTAGHCVKFGGTYSPWRHGSVDIGDCGHAGGICVQSWTNHANADVGIGNTGQLASLPSVRNALLVDNSPVTVLKIQETRTWSQQTVGLPVCRMGRTSGRQCGTILDNDETKKSEVSGQGYVWIDHTIVYSRDALGGDSGGPLFLTDQDTPTSTPWAILLGTHIHSTPNDADIDPNGSGWYSPQDRERNVISSLGAEIVPCTSTTCGLP